MRDSSPPEATLASGRSGMEREVHRGKYNDVNLLVDLELPPAGEFIDRMKGWDWSEAAARGLDAELLAQEPQTRGDGPFRQLQFADIPLVQGDGCSELEGGATIEAASG